MIDRVFSINVEHYLQLVCSECRVIKNGIIYKVCFTLNVPY